MQKETYKIIRNKKRKSVDVFYKRYGKKLLAYALSNWKTDEDTAWEMIYKTFDSIIDNIERYEFESEKKFSSFVQITFLNKLRNHYRDKKKSIQTISGQNLEIHADESAEIKNEDSSQMKNLKEELAKLQDWERMLLLLRAQQMPYSEIAKYVNKPQDQLKVYYSRLKQKITKSLTQKKEVYHG